jgi:hypothetical protein
VTNTTNNTNHEAQNIYDRVVAAGYDRRVRELASDLADRVEAGEITDTEANEFLATAQDRWVDAPWG